MEIRFWGVRGSVPVPGAATERTGGNTSCIEVRAGGERLVLDAGTGLRCLGDSLASGPARLTLLLSHLHWDHIQGLPFFTPLYSPTTQLEVVGAVEKVASVEEALAQQMRPPQFPVDWRQVPAARTYRTLTPGDAFEVGPVHVRTVGLNHPGGVVGYRLDHEGASVVYATDTEHHAHLDAALCELAEGADVLIHDAQYTPREYAGLDGPSRVGWGHSTWTAAVDLADAAGVGQLVLHHHDPARDDDAVDAIERRARTRLPHTRAAREGLCIRLGEADHDALLPPPDARPGSTPQPCASRESQG